MKTLLNIFLLALSFNVFAQNEVQGEQLIPIKMNEEYTIKRGDLKIITLPRYTFIDRIAFEVKNSTFCSEDSIRISFDGLASQNVQVNGGISGYRSRIVTALTNSKTVEIFNGTDCKIKVKNIEVLPRRIQAGTRYPHSGPVIYASEASAQVSFLLDGLMFLDSLVNDYDRVNHLSPGKKIVGQALAVLNNAPETSQASIKAITTVIQFLESKQGFLERLATIESTFQISQDIQSVKVSLERMIR